MIISKLYFVLAAFAFGLMLNQTSGLSLNEILSSLDLGGVQTILEGYASGEYENINNFVGKTTKEFWNRMETRDLLKYFSIEELEKIRNSGSTVPDRTKKEIKRLLITPDKTLSQLRSTLNSNDVTDGELLQIARALPSPDFMTKENVQTLGDGLLKLGLHFLLRFEDNEAIQELSKMAKSKFNSARSDSEERKRYEIMKVELFKKVNGDPSSWTTENFDKSMITKENVKMIDPVVFSSKRQEIIQSVAGSDDHMLRRAILLKSLDILNLFDETDTDTTLTNINGMSSLKQDIQLEDIRNEGVRTNSRIKEILDSNVRTQIQKNTLNPKSEKLVAMEFAKRALITKEELTSKGREVLGLAGPSDIKRAANSNAFTENEVPEIFKGIRKGEGPLTDAKLRILSKVVKDHIKDETKPSLQKYSHGIIYNLPQTTIKKMHDFETKSFLSKTTSPNVDATLVSTLLLKVNDGFNSFKPAVKMLIPSQKTKGYSRHVLFQISQDLPPTSAQAMMTAEETYKDISKIKKSDISNTKDIIKQIGVQEAKKFETENLPESLAVMKDVNPQLSACIELKNLWAEYSEKNFGSIDEKTAIKKLTLIDIELLPVCVIAAFGAPLLNLLESDMKIILLKRFGKMTDAEFSVSRPARMAIVGEGLHVSGSGRGLNLGDLELVGNRIADTTANKILNADKAAIPYIIKKLLETIKKEKRMPCLNSEQRAAIASILIKDRGHPSVWESVQDIGCLVRFLDESNLRNLHSEVLASASCELMKKSRHTDDDDDTLQESCSITKYQEKMYESERLKAAIMVEDDLRRARTSTQSSKQEICYKTSLIGANGLTTSELKSLDFDDIMMCLEELGAVDMLQTNAEILAQTIFNGIDKDMSKLNETTLAALGFIFKGFSAGDMKDLKSFEYGGHDEVVAMIGKKPIFDESQKSVLSKEIKLEWRRTSKMNAEDILTVKHMICLFGSSDIASMDVDAVRLGFKF